MKKYKAIIIDGKKLFRRFTAGLLLLSLLLIGARLCAFSLQRAKFSFTPSAETMLGDVIPSVTVTANATPSVRSQLLQRGSVLFSLLFQWDIKDPSTMLKSEIPLTDAILSGGLAQRSASAVTAQPDTAAASAAAAATAEAARAQEQTPSADDAAIPEERRAAIKSIDAAPPGGQAVTLGNETSYTVDVNEALKTPLSIDMNTNGPKVLVIHTHATESYAREGSDFYDITASDRSTDPSENVIAAGNAFCDILNRHGIETVHDTALHDYPSFNGSYAHALSAIEDYLKRYPSIQMVFDIHRDSIVYDDNTKARVVTKIDGKPAAQLMFVVGTDQKGLYHPDWRENIKCAIHLQDTIARRYPTLMRRINLRQERFNGHTTHASMIIETGSSGNSLSEAVYGLSLAAECIGDYLNSLK